MLCGSASEAQRATHALFDNDLQPREPDVWGLGHQEGCRCTLCLWPCFESDEGDAWLAAGPGMQESCTPECEVCADRVETSAVSEHSIF